MKKLLFILSTLIASTSAHARIQVFKCAPEVKPAVNEINYLFVRDLANSKVAVFSKQVVADASKDKGWKVVDGKAEVNYPNPASRNAQAYADVGALDPQSIDWSHTNACFISKPLLSVSFQLLDTDFAPIFLTAQNKLQVFRNPKLTEQECPTPMPLPGREEKYVCDSL